LFYIDDKFDDYIDSIYLIELEIKDTTDTVRFALNQKKKGKGTNNDLYTQNTLMSNTNPLKTGVNSGAPDG
jgi:hypothetical protein